MNMDSYFELLTDMEKFFRIIRWVNPQDLEGNHRYIDQIDQCLLTRSLVLNFNDLIQCDIKYDRMYLRNVCYFEVFQFAY